MTRGQDPRPANGHEHHLALAGGLLGLMTGVLVGLVTVGDQLFLPVLHASLGTVAGAALAVAARRLAHARHAERAIAEPVDPERWARRVAAHRAIAELEVSGPSEG